MGGYAGGDFIDHPFCFGRLVLQLLYSRRFAAGRCPQDFIVTEFVEADKPVRPADDFPRRAIILLQSHDLGLGPIVFEAEDVGHFGPAPAVNRLIVVAHHANVFDAWRPGLL